MGRLPDLLLRPFYGWPRGGTSGSLAVPGPGAWDCPSRGLVWAPCPSGQSFSCFFSAPDWARSSGAWTFCPPQLSLAGSWG